MKKHLTKIVILIALIFIILGIFIYKDIIQKKVDNVSYKTLLISDLNNDSTYTISTNNQLGEIYQLELSIVGSSTAIFSLLISDKTNAFTKEIRLKNGIIDRDFIVECNNHDIKIEVKTEPNTVGSLKIDYRFITF